MPSQPSPSLPLTFPQIRTRHSLGNVRRSCCRNGRHIIMYFGHIDEMKWDVPPSISLNFFSFLFLFLFRLSFFSPSFSPFSASFFFPFLFLFFSFFFFFFTFFIFLFFSLLF